MLFVDHDEPELLKRDRLLNQRLRADARMYLAILQCILQVSLFRGP